MTKSTYRLLLVLLALVLALGVLSGFASSDSATTQDGTTDNGTSAVCEHKNNKIVYTAASQTRHAYDVVCKDCGAKVEENEMSDHSWYKDQCQDCDYTCKHDLFSYYVSLDTYPAVHRQMTVCSYCDYLFHIDAQHTFVDMKCKDCDWVCDHGEGNAFGYDADKQQYCCVNHCGKYYFHYYIDDQLRVFFNGIESFKNDTFYTGRTADALLYGENYLALCYEDGSLVSPDSVPQLGYHYKLVDKGYKATIDACSHKNVDGSDAHVTNEDNYRSYCKLCGHKGEGKG